MKQYKKIILTAFAGLLVAGEPRAQAGFRDGFLISSLNEGSMVTFVKDILIPANVSSVELTEYPKQRCHLKVEPSGARERILPAGLKLEIKDLKYSDHTGRYGGGPDPAYYIRHVNLSFELSFRKGWFGKRNVLRVFCKDDDAFTIGSTQELLKEYFRFTIPNPRRL